MKRKPKVNHQSNHRPNHQLIAEMVKRGDIELTGIYKDALWIEAPGIDIKELVLCIEAQFDCKIKLIDIV